MKILFIADIHSGKDANYPECGGKYYVNTFGSQFEQYLDKIHLLEKEHDLTINLGDLIYNTDHEDDLLLFKKEERLLEGDAPLAHVLGNHDFRYLFKNQLSKIINEENTYYSFDLGGYHHIVLDSFQGSKPLPGNISHGQILWLKEDLEKTNLPTLVYTHYPLDNQSLVNNYYFKNEPEKAFCQNKDEIRIILESSKKVLAVFCGHLHFYNQETINGILYVTAPSFSENDGYDKPKAECLSVDLKDKNINILVKNLK